MESMRSRFLAIGIWFVLTMFLPTVSYGQTSLDPRWGSAGSYDNSWAAGHEANGTPLYVCRANYNGGVHPGKVVAGNCNIGWGGNEIVLHSFEVLTTGSASSSVTTAVAEGPVAITGSYKHTSPPGQWSRGMATTMYCGNSPESWVRGNATFDRPSGTLSLTIQLETDSTSAGPKGRLLAVLKDTNGNELATATSDEIGTGGKPPGHSAIRDFTSHSMVPQEVASKVASIYLDAQCTGSVDRLWNVSLDTVQDAFKIGVMIAGAF